MLIVARQQGALNHTNEGVREQGTHGSMPGYPRRASNVNRRQREFALRNVNRRQREFALRAYFV